MGSLFSTLGVGYSGLSAATTAIDVTSQNIANAETDGYSRQRIVSTAATPLSTNSGLIGNGVEITDVQRIFDNFVYDRYKDSASSKEYSDYEREKLEELSTYFPEVEQSGIKEDLQEYYNLWQSLADNPDNDSVKAALAKQTELLTSHITQTQEQVTGLQNRINEELKINIDEVNDKAQQIADLNIQIDTAEAGGAYTANDLRDKRSLLEKDLAELIGAEAISGQLESNIQIDSSSNTKTGSYTINVNGYNIVDGGSVHPLTLTNENEMGFYDISYKRQDGIKIPIAEEITGGKIGSILNLRGADLDTTSGMPTDGVIQTVISEFDAFAQGLIESTNNLYAANATTSMQSNVVEVASDAPILQSNLNVKEGSFDIVVYDVDGKEAARKSINIDTYTTISGGVDSNSLQAQITGQSDDNGDGNANNDVDDFINFNWATFQNGDNAIELTLDPMSKSKGYTFAIEDNLKTESFSSGTNFAGAFGMNRYFDGDDASNIRLNSDIRENSSTMSAGATANDGDNSIALNIAQQQYETFDFKVGNNTINSTIYGMFDMVATEVGSAANTAISRNESITAQYNAIEMEHNSISGVSIDEELTNLIKYQTSYSAAAKVISTVDEMMQTLLGIKS